MLQTRVWTALIALPAVLAAVLFAPPLIFEGVIWVFTVWGLYEVGSMTGAYTPGAVLILIVLGCGSATALLHSAAWLWILPAAVILAMLVLVALVASGAEHNLTPNILMPLGALWVGALFPYFTLLRNGPDGVGLVVLVLLLVVASDTGAYFAGTWLGRTKLLPRVSPKKTIEGAIGGLCLSVVAGLTLWHLLIPQWSVGQASSFSISISILAQLGDLAGSAFKRSVGVKDSGWIFPGHGGLLDRTCSIVFPVVLTYYWIG